MFKALIIQVAIEKLKQFLDNPKNEKIKQFLLKEETQETMLDIYGKYADFVEENEG